MKKILYSAFFSMLLMMVSCKKDIIDLNVNPKQPEAVPSATLLSNAEINLSDVLASANVNTNIFRLIAQHWTQTTYTDESNYNLNSRSISDRWFAEFYRDVLADLTEASRILESEKEQISVAVYNNKKVTIEILIVFAYYHLLATYGDIPYTEALNIDIVQPKYDPAPEVFDKLIVRLDEALALINPAEQGYAQADIILQGDMSKWKMFGNSLKMRMGMLIIDVDPGKSSTMILAAAPNVVSSNNENLMIHYLTAPPNTNPLWEDLVQSGRSDFVGANTLVDKMKALNDPRIPLFFEKNEQGNYVGGIYGSVNNYNSFSAPTQKLSAPEFPHTFFSYAEMEFYKAEAIERGIAVGGTAEEHYNNAVTASIEEWGGTPAEAAAYLAQPEVNYQTAPGTFKEKIGVQSWIALYNRGFDAWTQWRRLDAPALVAPPNNQSGGAVPVRFTYPVIEQNLNKANYQAAATAIGADKMSTKLWFDKH